MIKQPLDLVVWIWMALNFVGLGYFVAGFSRLFVQAWKMPNRRTAVWKVVNIKPRRNAEWPNSTPEADLIVRGATLMLPLWIIAGGGLIVALLGRG